MNQAELLDQFVIEARECVEVIGKRLLDVERDPDNEELLNDLFRSVHTLKGNCGLFDFQPLERVVHAGEDLLDQVRHRTLAYSAALADALLEAMDYAAQLIDQIERNGRIEDGADARSTEHAAALRAFVCEAAPVEAMAAIALLAQACGGAAAAPQIDDVAPSWLGRLDLSLLASKPSVLALRYLPEPGCFFKGEDPWRLARTVPGLLQLHVEAARAWPQGDERAAWDCYQCNLDIALCTDAPLTEVEAHFRCVAEQVVWRHAATRVRTTAVADEHAPAPAPEPASDGDVPPLLRLHASALWSDQCELLARAGDSAGAVLAARRVLTHLLACLGDAPGAIASVALAGLAEDVSGASLLAWARRHIPAADAAARVAELAATQNPDREVAGGVAVPVARAEEGAAPQAHKVIKVGQEKIDRLMDLIGEMVVAKNSLPYLAQRAEEVFQQRELAREIKVQYAVINRIADDLQHAIMQVRMLPVGAVFQRFGRLIRDISRKLGKEVTLVLEGEDTEADKNVIESLADPLIHILRNSLDHGIELPHLRRAAGKPPVGTIRIAARQESDRVIIEIHDDGAGVNAARVRDKAVQRGLIPADRAATLSDEDAVQLVFLPGFSTADEISDLSGRGVGMDVVRTAVERLHGSVELSSVQGQGTTLRLSLPLSMAVTTVMVIDSAGHRLGVTMDMVVETVRIPACRIHSFKQARSTVLRGRVVPLRALNELLALDAAPIPSEDGELAVLVIRHGNESVGLLVDHFHGASDIILKPLEGVLAGLVGFAGTALMGDGGVLMVLNPKELLQ